MNFKEKMLSTVSSALGGVLLEAWCSQATIDVSVAFCCSLSLLWLLPGPLVQAPQTVAGISVPSWLSHTIPTSTSCKAPSASRANHRQVRTPFIASHLMAHGVGLMTRIVLWRTDAVKSQKHKSLCLNLFSPPLSFSFPSLPSYPSSFPPFLFARGRACGQGEPGRSPASTSPSPLLTLQVGDGERHGGLLSWGPGVLTPCHLQSPVSFPAPSLEGSSWHSFILFCWELPWAPCLLHSPALSPYPQCEPQPQESGRHPLEWNT